MSDYRDLDWEMFTGHMFSKKELDEIYQQGRADERVKVIEEITNRLLSDYEELESVLVLDIIEGILEQMKEVENE